MAAPYIADVNRPDPLKLVPESHHRLTVEHYHRMIEAGVLGPNDKVELLEGVLLEMTPQSPAHARIIRILTAILVRGAGPGYEIGVQTPLTVSNISEPEPDLTVIPAGTSIREHPSTALLAVEVSRSSSKRDRVLKVWLYARASIPEYWIIDADRQEVDVLRDPDASSGEYKSLVTVGRDATLNAAAVPGISVPLSQLFPRD